MCKLKKEEEYKIEIFSLVGENIDSIDAIYKGCSYLSKGRYGYFFDCKQNISSKKLYNYKVKILSKDNDEIINDIDIDKITKDIEKICLINRYKIF